MKLTELTAISPVDGRYRSKCERLDEFFSEYALIRYRVKVEVEYFIALCELPLPALKGVDHAVFAELRKIYEDFTVEDATRIKEIESVTNHDVKAVEYFLKDAFIGKPNQPVAFLYHVQHFRPQAPVPKDEFCSGSRFFPGLHKGFPHVVLPPF